MRKKTYSLVRSLWDGMGINNYGKANLNFVSYYEISEKLHFYLEPMVSIFLLFIQKNDG